MKQRQDRRRAFALDAAIYTAAAAAKAAWWTAAGRATRALVRPTEGEQARKFAPTTPPVSGKRLRDAYLSAFEKDRRDVAAGLYPAMDTNVDAAAVLQRAMDVLSDARSVDQRRRQARGTEVREVSSSSYPAYYRQNFHYQTGGWFTEDSAKRYEAQVEALFSGAAGAMRRRALSLLAQAWRERDQRGLKVLDLACGSGGFLKDLKAAFPRARVMGLDLSPTYTAEARAKAGTPVAQANAERLPFADASLDAVTCIYLFHELPPRVRSRVAAEIARVLKPGGVLAFADSVQPSDEPDLARLLEAFPAFFHEPYYASYAAADLPALFTKAGFVAADRDKAFLTKSLLFRRS
ncbi:MAG TPA: class I SAM-dependent methyltransferase [Caulobacteraceae bacterium]